MPNLRFTNEIVTAAIAGFEEQKREIDTQIAALRSLLSGRSAGEEEATPEPKRRRRRRRGAGRKASATGAKPKRKLSAAGKAAIVAALKKRWAAKRAEDAKKK